MTSVPYPPTPYTRMISTNPNSKPLFFIQVKENWRLNQTRTVRTDAFNNWYRAGRTKSSLYMYCVINMYLCYSTIHVKKKPCLTLHKYIQLPYPHSFFFLLLLLPPSSNSIPRSHNQPPKLLSSSFRRKLEKSNSSLTSKKS